jgi:hypothetical protein
MLANLNGGSFQFETEGADFMGSEKPVEREAILGLGISSLSVVG